MRGSAVAETRDVPYGFATLDRLYMRAVRARRTRRERSEVSCCLKYFVFGFNFIFTLFGSLLLVAGLWAWTEKAIFTSLTNLAIDPVLFFVLAGLFMLIIGFTGCTGALRENTTCLCFFCASIGIIFCCEVSICVLGFVYKDWVIQQVKTNLNVIVVNYRDNIDLRDLIDWIQAHWLLCCGIEGPRDWEMNMYFNCTSPSAEKCGVPPSCCRLEKGVQLRNLLCGRNIRHPSMTRFQLDRIYTIGCVYAGQKWFEKNVIPVAAIFVALAILQIFAICLAQNLRGDIFAQRAKWNRPVANL